MNRWDWMVMRGLIPAAFALVLSFGTMWIISGWQSRPYLAGMVPTARWIPVAALAFAVVHGAWVSYRLWQAERGEGLLCECGGLLGAEREGRYGLYRRCLACSRNVARRHYE